MQIYESGEMYLETILELQQKQENVRSVDIVNEMGLAKSSVSEGIKVLKNNGFLEVSNEGFITLTESGMEIAKTILERHKTLTKFFISMGVNADIAEQDACKIEHVIHKETFEAIKKQLK